MNSSTAARIGIAGIVAGAGLAAGGIAVASAEDTAGSTASSSAHPGGHRGGPGVLAETLAEELDLEQSDVEDALAAVREDLRPDAPAEGEKPTPPSDEERADRQAALAKALAKELDVSEAKVTAALAAAEKQAASDREERQAESRTALVERLDAAVEDGTLTKADKTSVLKAYDAELLGGGPGLGGPGGRGAGGPGGPKADAAS
ncbi:hypothetical protein [Aeromicrobium sp. Leaf245]|uniref:hypothetical protein n=1 Tax=Aeromicrobium sp. Leaf245 TaxID=1736306 RepID=UPI000B2B7D49|nr:hypothetical protein [Aeromicrobium sp. Leaf245]